MGVAKILGLFLAILVARQALGAPGFSLRSSYQDASTSEAEFFSGRGLYFRLPVGGAPPRVFLLTASHISQGKGLSLDSSLDILGRLASPLLDLELFEVRPKLPDPEWVDSLPYLEPKSGQILFHGDVAGLQGLGATLIPQARMKNRGDWSVVEEIFAKGWSGLAAFSPLREFPGHFALTGVYLASERFFPRSYFAGQSAVIRILKAFLNGQRGKMDSLEWNLRRGLLYRSSNRIRESQALNSAGGRGMRGDGGGARREESQSLSDQLASHRSGGHFSANPELEFQTTYSLEIEREPVLAFGESCGNRGTAYLAAEWEAYARLHDRIHANMSYLAVREGSELVEELRRRLRIIVGASGQEKFSLSLPSAVLSLEIESHEIKLSFQGEDGDSFAIELGKNGFGRSKKLFEPVIIARGIKSGHRYFVDLRELFFVGFEGLGNPCDAYFSSIAVSIRRETETNTLRFKKNKSTTVLTDAFN